MNIWKRRADGALFGFDELEPGFDRAHVESNFDRFAVIDGLRILNSDVCPGEHDFYDHITQGGVSDGSPQFATCTRCRLAKLTTTEGHVFYYKRIPAYEINKL